jgi:hypothetical protein
LIFYWVESRYCLNNAKQYWVLRPWSYPIHDLSADTSVALCSLLGCVVFVYQAPKHLIKSTTLKKIPYGRQQLYGRYGWHYPYMCMWTVISVLIATRRSALERISLRTDRHIEHTNTSARMAVTPTMHLYIYIVNTR